MSGDSLSILIRAILEKSSKSQIETELKNIEQKLKPIEVKTNMDVKNLDKYKEKFVDMQNSVSGITQKTKEWTKINGETVKQIENIKTGTDEVTRRVTETTTNYKKQRDELAKVNVEQSKYWNQRRKETLDSMTSKPDALVKMADYYKQLEKESAQVVKQTNAVTQSLLNQQNIIARRDFNWGKLITGINASTFDSGDNFSSYIKRQYGDSAELIGKFNDKQLRTGEIITQANFRVKEGTDKWRMYQATLNKTTGEMRMLDNGLKDVSNRQLKFNEAMKIAITRIFQWGVATSLVYGSLRQLKEGLTTLKEIDTALIDIAKVTNYTNDQMKELTKTAIDAGQEFGRTAQEYLSSVTEFARAGMGKQSEEYAKLSLLLQNVGDVTAETANETLLAANAGFQLGGSYEKLMEIIDKFNNISNLNATNVNKLSEAMKVGASVFHAAGMSIDETIAIIGTATASTQRPGSEISRAWRTILMNIRQVADEEAEVTEESMKKAEKALNSIGIVVRDSPSTFRPMFEIISDLGKSWSNLTEVEQAYIAESLAGKRQANVLISTLQNWDMAEKQLVESIGASGSAIQENSIYLNSWEAKAKRLNATMTEFWSNMFNTDAIKNLIDGLNGLVRILDVLINNSFSSFILQVGLTSTALYGLMLVSKALSGTQALGGLILFSGRLINSFKLVATGASTLTFELAGLSATTKALTATMLASPLFKIALATTAIYAIIKGIDAVTTSAKEAKEQLDKLNNSISTISNELKNSKDLQQSYDELSKKENQSAEDKQKLLQVTKDLGNIFPGIISKYDSEGNAIEINSTKLEKYIKLKEQELQLKKEELASNFVANREELGKSAIGKPNIASWWKGETTFTDWISGIPSIDTLTKELGKYEQALLKLKSSNQKQIRVNGILVNREELEDEIAKTRTLLNNALSEQRTSIEEYKRGLRASLDINKDFENLNDNALNLFIESIGDNLQKLQTTGNKIDGLDLAESLGSNGQFVDELNKINIEFEQNKKNVNLTEDAYKQWHDEAVKSISDIILYQGKIGSRKLADTLAKDLVDGLGEIKIGATEGATALEKYQQAVEALGGVYKDSSASIKELQGFLDELNNKGLSMESVNKMLESYPELIQYLGDEKTLREEITKRVKDYQDSIYDAFVLTKQYDTDFYNDVKSSHVDLFSQLAKLYNTNIDNWANQNDAIRTMTETLISDLGVDWSKYFEAFQTGSLLVNPTSGGAFKQLEYGGLAVDNEAYARLKGLADFQEAMREQAAKFKSLNVSSSLANSKSKSSTPSAIEAEDLSSELIKSYNYQVEIDKLQSKSLEKQIKIASAAKDYNQQISLTNKLLENQNKTIEDLKTANEKINQEAENIRKQNPQLSTESWFDVNGEATTEYKKALNTYAGATDDASKAAHKNIQDTFQSLYNLKKAWRENTEQIDSMGDSIDSTAQKLKDLYVDSYKSTLQTELDAQEKRLNHLNNLSEKRISHYESEIKSLESEADLEKEITERKERQLEISKLQTELENTQKEKNQRVLQTDGTWKWTADQSKINDLNDQIAEKETSLSEWEADLIVEQEKKRLQALIDGENEIIKTRQEKFDIEKENFTNFFSALESATTTSLDNLNAIYGAKLNAILATIQSSTNSSKSSKSSNSSSSDGNVYTTDSHGNKIYVDSTGTIHKYDSGGETQSTGLHWLDGKLGKPERVLTDEQNNNWNVLTANLPSLLNNMKNIMSYIPSITTPNYSFAGIGANNNSAQSSVVYNISGVTVKANNGEQFISSLENIVKTMKK